MIPKRPTTIRIKNVTLFYTDKTPKKMNERAVEICKRYGVEAELVKLRAAAQEVEGLRQRNQELLRANDQTAMRESPEFEAAVTKPLDE
ncbi:MAG: hypothetical protein KGD60_15080, partial [Candidatus Thorarchaeota archaeon]|nr:hypothetical protein [Candidatus Thorarchaeota archaeon]